MDNVELTRNSEQTANLRGAFISHTGGDASFKEITERMALEHIGFIGDSQIAPGDDFHQRLRLMLTNAISGIVLISDGIFDSPWVMYEIGMLEGMGKGVVLFCDADRMPHASKIPEFLRGYEIIHNISQLYDRALGSSVFDNIFVHETLELSRLRFREALANKREGINLTLKIPGLSVVDVADIHFDAIIVRLAAAGTIDNANEQCPVTNETRKTGECRMRPNNELGCAIMQEVECCKHPETVALNSLLGYTHTAEDGESIQYLLPLHSNFGVTFKCFVDVYKRSLKGKLEQLLSNAGMLDVTYSESAETQRIYFLLPENREDGLYHIFAPEGFANNFLCPNAAL
jgi:hypothetical protein